MIDVTEKDCDCHQEHCPGIKLLSSAKQMLNTTSDDSMKPVAKKRPLVIHLSDRYIRSIENRDQLFLFVCLF